MTARAPAQPAHGRCERGKIYGAITGFVREPDEGTAAHLWQLLMAAQLPLGVFFAATWMPRAPRWAWGGLALEAAVVIVNLAIVHSFGL